MAKKKETVEQTPVAAEVSQEQKKDSTKDIIVKLLLKTGRERMEDLIAEMEEIQPAPFQEGNQDSARHHGTSPYRSWSSRTSHWRSRCDLLTPHHSSRPNHL